MLCSETWAEFFGRLGHLLNRPNPEVIHQVGPKEHVWHAVSFSKSSRKVERPEKGFQFDVILLVNVQICSLSTGIIIPVMCIYSKSNSDTSSIIRENSCNSWQKKTRPQNEMHPNLRAIASNLPTISAPVSRGRVKRKNRVKSVRKERAQRACAKSVRKERAQRAAISHPNRPRDGG